MPWDPLNILPRKRRWLWAFLACWAALFQGPSFIRSLRPPRDIGVDFFQEWASARNYLEGLPLYTGLRESAKRYLNLTIDPQTVTLMEVNAHPPTANLLALPLARLDYQDAVLVWNLFSLAALGVSLWLIGRELGLVWSPWMIFPVVTLLLLCNPFRQQINQGQLNAVLLLLLTGVWMADRRNRLVWAGVLVGAATTIKLFPALLIVYFAFRSRWTAVFLGIATVAAITVLTAALVGTDAYRDYAFEALPEVAWFRAAWPNASIAGFWSKLFDPALYKPRDWCQIVPLSSNPKLAFGGCLISDAVILGMLAQAVRRCRSQPAADLAFGLTLLAMLLLSPITWDHYFLMLAIPLGLLWVRLPASPNKRLCFLLLVMALWFEPRIFYQAVILGGFAQGIAYPIHTVTVLSYQFYTLLILFALLWLETRAAAGESSSSVVV